MLISGTKIQQLIKGLHPGGLNGGFGDSFTAQQYKSCAKVVYDLVRDPYLRTFSEILYSHFDKGMPAFNFSFPDTAGKQVRLSDFKGKVVLIDVYGPHCSSCIEFGKRFEKDIYPELKDNSNFAVISISIGYDKALWLSDLKKGIYSKMEYINLFAAGVDNSFCRYYNLSSIPYLLLVDKNGKVYAKTNDIYFAKNDQLKAMIKGALEEN